MAELLDADTYKAAQKERDRRMREINTANEIQVRTETASRDVPKFKQFSEALWKVYLVNKQNPRLCCKARADSTYCLRGADGVG